MTPKNSENNGTEEIGLVTPTPGLLTSALTREFFNKNPFWHIITHFYYMW